MSQSASREIIDRVKDDSSSLVCLRDSSSLRSERTYSTDGSSLLSRMFDFDHKLMSSKVYQGQMRSFMRRKLRKEKRPEGTSSTVNGIGVRSGKHFEMHQSANIERQLRRDRKLEEKQMKLLLLGSQEDELYATFDVLCEFGNIDRPEESKLYKGLIISCILDTMIIILEELPETISREVASGEMQTVVTWLSLPAPAQLPMDVATVIMKLWRNDAVKDCYRLHKHQICWQAPGYFLDSINRIARPDFVPNDLDILLAKQERGITEFQVSLGELNYRFIKPDSSTTSNLRRQLAMFDHVHAIIFEVDISSYEEVISNSESIEPSKTTSPLHKAFEYFRSLCESYHMRAKPIFLILNHHTRSFRKLKTCPLEGSCPDYTGGADPELAMGYLVQRFRSLNLNKDRDIYVHLPDEGHSKIRDRYEYDFRLFPRARHWTTSEFVIRAANGIFMESNLSPPMNKV